MIQNLYWYICKAPSNMGDMIAPYIFKKITGQDPKRTSPLAGIPFFYHVVVFCSSVIKMPLFGVLEL